VLSAVLVCLCAFICGTSGQLRAGCGGSADYGPENNFPVILGPSNSKVIGTNKNGKAYLVTVPNSGGNTVSNFSLLHVYGTPYEMGRAQGELLKAKTVGLVAQVWDYLRLQVEENLPNYFPKWFSDLIADLGLDAALDFTEAASYAYTPQHFLDEIQGLCDGSGADYSTVYKIHMIAGLTQGDCSMFGAWGSAVPVGGSLLQLRALDWNMDGPFRDFSQITVYHPSTGFGHDFANVGFTGFIGGLTGVSATQLGISEIGAAYPDASFGDESRIGVPFIFLLRDILQFDYTLDDAINRMINSRRTCNLMLGVGDGKLNEFRGFQYSYSVLNVFDDQNLRPNATWHPKIKDVVYWGMDWICPAYDRVLSSLIMKYHGSLTPEVAIKSVSAVEKSGDNHIAFYDLTKMNLYVSFAAANGIGGPVAAYDRQYTKWDLKQLFAETL